MGNGLFGLGWSLTIPSIKRKTEKELPQYLDAIDSDTYLIAGAEDLVPEFKKDNAGNFVLDGDGNFLSNEFDLIRGGIAYAVRRYRPRIEGGFSKLNDGRKKVPVSFTGVLHPGIT